MSKPRFGVPRKVIQAELGRIAAAHGGVLREEDVAREVRRPDSPLNPVAHLFEGVGSAGGNRPSPVIALSLLFPDGAVPSVRDFVDAVRRGRTMMGGVLWNTTPGGR